MIHIIQSFNHCSSLCIKTRKEKRGSSFIKTKRETKKTEMAELFKKQAKLYAETRPTYPPEIFQFIASKTPNHDLAWDVATGSGQAAVSLASIYKKVVATDNSSEQLAYARELPNIRYHHTSPGMSLTDLERVVSTRASVDVVTVAQALHWFDLPALYQHVNWILRRPGGIFAAWCYTEAMINESIDPVFLKYCQDLLPFIRDSARKIVSTKYRDIEFPFEPVDGEDHTGPFRFESKKPMDLGMFLAYLRSMSPYQTAREKGVELLSEEVVSNFERAWGENGSSIKLVTFPIYLRIGRVVN